MPARPALAALAVLLTAAAGGASAGAADDVGCHRDEGARPRLARLQQAMVTGRFVTYEPTSVEVRGGHHVRDADAASIRADLELLRTHFDALITYEAGHGLEQVPAIAERLGYRALLLGVWNPADPDEVTLALRTARAHPKLVVGLVLGNETIFRHNLSVQQLAALFERVHTDAPSLPLAVSEPFHLLEGAAAAPLRAQADALLPNVHPVYQAWFVPGRTERQGAQMVRNVIADLRAAYCGPVLVKETGEPSDNGQPGYSETNQAAFWRELQALLPPSREAAYSWFAAFDLPWREDDGGLASEAHWGLYDGQRRAKAVVSVLAAGPGGADPR